MTPQAELAHQEAMYQACLNARKSPEYWRFSDSTRQAEVKAFDRMDRRIAELRKEIEG